MASFYFSSCAETGVVIGPSQRPRFHSVTTASLSGLTSPTSPYGKSTSSVIYPSSSGIDDEEHVFISSGGSSIPCITSVTPKVCSTGSVGSSPGGTSSSQSSLHGGLPAKSALKSVSSSASNSSTRSFYVSLANVPKGKTYRSFPSSTMRSSSTKNSLGTRLLSSTISPPIPTSSPPNNNMPSKSACIFSTSCIYFNTFSFGFNLSFLSKLNHYLTEFQVPIKMSQSLHPLLVILILLSAIMSPPMSQISLDVQQQTLFEL